MTGKTSYYRYRRLPLNGKWAAILEAVPELRLACNGQWQFLASELQERRWEDEDQDASLRPNPTRAWSKFAQSYQLGWSSAVRGLEYDLAVAFYRAADQHQRWPHMKRLYRHIGSFCDGGRLNSILIWKSDCVAGGEASKA